MGAAWFFYMRVLILDGKKNCQNITTFNGCHYSFDFQSHAAGGLWMGNLVFQTSFYVIIYWFNQVNFKLYFVDGKRVYVSNQDKFIFEDNFHNEIVQVYSFAKGIMILCMKFWISSLRFYLYLCEFVIAFMESKSLGIIW